MTCRASFTTASVMLFLASQPPAQVREQETQKPALIQALGQLRDSLQQASRQNRAFAPLAADAENSRNWFVGKAESWIPQTPDEGSGMRTALERMARAIGSLPSDAGAAEALLKEVAQDLKEKVEYCRQNGLGARRQVRVVTKRGGIAEVKGLEVYYLEKFFASAANAQPLQFRGFSSPALDDLPPGRYVFWAKESGAAGKNGPRKEGRVGVPPSDDTIEVLVP